MAFDQHSNFGFGTVSIAPSPALSGTTFSMSNSDASRMPDPSVANYNLTIWPSNARPSVQNSEIVRVTARGVANSGGTGHTLFTIVRAQEGTSAQTVNSTYWVGNNITKKWFDDLENALVQRTAVTVGTQSGADYVCDGVSDNVEIQAAINSLSATGGEVKLKPGTYDIRASITVPDNITITGTRKAVLKRNVSMTSGIMLKNADAVAGNSRIRLKGFKIDGSSDLVTAVDGMESIRFDLCSDVKFEDLEVINSPSEGIQFHRGQNCHVVGCRVIGTATILGSHKAGIIISGNTTSTQQSMDCSIVDCYTENTAGEGVSSYYSQGTKLCRNTVNWTSGSTNNCQIQIEHSINVVCTENVVTSNYYGIVCLSSQQVTISDNDVKAAATNGIIVEGSSRDVSIGPNILANIQQHGIVLQDTARNVSITGVKIVDAGLATASTYSAIYLDPNGGYVRRVSITGCHAYASATNKIVSFISTLTDTNNRVTDLYESGNFSEGQTGSFRNIDNTTFVGLLTNKQYVTVGTTSDCDYVCDGVNDNVKIQAALDYVNNAGGGTVFICKGTYNCASTVLTIGSNTELVGENRLGTVIKKNAATNSSVLTNKDTTNGNSFITIKNLTIDQNGVNQTTGGGGMSFTGFSDSTLENVTVKKSYNFNVIVLSLAGATLTGTATFTNGSETVVGVGTSFTTQFAKYSIIKSAGGQFSRVLSVTDNTHLVLDRPWGWATESAVAVKLIPPNARNRIINCTFEGNTHNDNVGLGLFDDSLVQGCVTHDSTGYGFGPDHTNRTKFIGNTSYNNPNSGIGMETCGYCVVTGNVFYNNSIGINLLSGSYRNVIANNNVKDSTSKGIGVGYNTTTYPPANENSILDNIVSGSVGSTGDGIYINGIDKTIISGNRLMNNARGGIVLALGSSVAPSNTMISNNYCYDNQTTKTQQYGIWIAAGTNTTLTDNLALDADHTTKGVLDAGTGTIINVSARTYAKVVGQNPDADYICDGVADEVEIQAAINSLTTGRTSVETVLLRGNFTVNNFITVPSYTRVVLDGKITTTTLRPSGASNWVDSMGVFELGNRTTKPVTQQAHIEFTPGSKCFGDYFNTNASSYPQDKANSGFVTDSTILNQKNVSAVHSYCTLIDCSTKGISVENMCQAVILEALGRTNGTTSKGNTIRNTSGRYVVTVVECYTNGFISDSLEIVDTYVENCIDDAVAVVGDWGGVTGGTGQMNGVLIDGVWGQKNGLRGAGVKLDGGTLSSGSQGSIRDATVTNVNLKTTQAILSGVTSSENGVYAINCGDSTNSRNILFSNIKCTGNWRFGYRSDMSGVEWTFNNIHLEALYGMVLKTPVVPQNTQRVTLSNVELVERNYPSAEAGSTGLAIMGGATAQGFQNITVRNLSALGFAIPLGEQGVSGVGTTGTIKNVDYEIDIMGNVPSDNVLNSTNRQLILKQYGQVIQQDSERLATLSVGSTSLSLVDQTPTMTSYFAPSGVASASSEFDTTTNAAWHAFDKTTTLKWTTATGNTTGWLRYDFPQGEVITQYTITGPISGQTTRGPKTWTFEGSHDGKTWAVLDTQTNVATWTALEQRTYVISSQTTAYKTYRINIIANQGDVSLLSLVGLKLSGINTLALIDSNGIGVFSKLSPVNVYDNGGAIYNVKSYGAVGDTKIVLDGAITVSTNILTSSSANFTSDDVGKSISIIGAGAQNLSGSGGGATGVYTLQAYITSVTNSTTVVISKNAVNTVSATRVVYGTNDKNAFDAAVSAASVNGGLVFVPAGRYRGDATIAPLYLPSNVMLVGAGQGATVISMPISFGNGTSGPTAPLIVNSQMRDFTLDGQHFPGNSSGIGYTNVQNCWVQDVTVINVPFWTIIGGFSTGTPWSPSLYFRRCTFDRGIFSGNPMAQDMSAINFILFVSMIDCEWRNNNNGYATLLYYICCKDIEIENIRFVNTAGANSSVNSSGGDNFTLRNATLMNSGGNGWYIRSKSLRISGVDAFDPNSSSSALAVKIWCADGVIDNVKGSGRWNNGSFTNGSSLVVHDSYITQQTSENGVQSVAAGSSTLSFTTAPFEYANGLAVDIDAAGTVERRTIVSGANTTTWTLDSPLTSAHTAPFQIRAIYAGNTTIQNSHVSTVTMNIGDVNGGTIWNTATLRMYNCVVSAASDNYGYVGLPGDSNSLITAATTINLDFNNVLIQGGLGFGYFAPATNLITYVGTIRNTKVFSNQSNSWVPAGKINLAQTMQVKFENVDIFTGWQVNAGTVFNNGSVFRNIRNATTNAPLALPTGVGTTPAVPASTTALTNNTGVDATVHIAGGTVTVVKVGAVTTGLTSPSTVRVPVGQTITLTYSVAPTWVWIGE